MIESKDISIVVQGAISSEYTKKSLESIRLYLPEAEIILSTWKNSVTDKLSYDILVLSDDPGTAYIDNNKTYNNVNRQIVSTIEGVKKASRKYCLKFRTDIVLCNTNILDYFERFQSYNQAMKFFNHRIVVGSYYTRNPRITPICFHPSDWIAFGETQDIINYYSIPLQPIQYFDWFKTKNKDVNLFPDVVSRYLPEQYICMEAVKKFMPIRLDNYFDKSNNNIAITEAFFANNIIVLDYKEQLGVEFVKYHPNRYGDKMSLLGYKDWLMLYEKYSNNHTSARWYFYLLLCNLKKLWFFYIRQIGIKVLKDTGLKEFAKKAAMKYYQRK